MPKKPKPKIEEVTREFGEAHTKKTDAEKIMAKNRKLFFDLLDGVLAAQESQLARKTIYYDGEDPEQHVATLYPKWRIVKKHEGDEGEWHILIQEDPAKKSFVYVNPLDKKVYQRSVGESAPQVDMERLEREAPHLWQQVTFQPPRPPRELKALDDLDEDQKAALLRFLTEPKLTNTMQAPRKAKPEELEGLPDT